MTKTNYLATAFLLSLLAVPTVGYAADKLAAVRPDNTEINTRDRNESEVTADNAHQATSDVEAMQKIRKAIVNDNTMSTYAQNIKVVAQGGRVTLKGPVRSQDEVQRIQAVANDVVGQQNVVNQLSVAGQPAAADDTTINTKN